MMGITGEGWLYSLAADPESNWGEVESFYDCVEQCRDPDGDIRIDSRVWGNLQTAGANPIFGDGFAFYHSSRAGFPPGDPFRGKPRISLIGQLLDIALDGREVSHIVVAVDWDLYKRLRRNPIVRDDSTRHLFESCGIVQGAVATMYKANKPTWRDLTALVAG